MSERRPRDKAIRECAYFLHTCLGFGWRKEDLDYLQKLWWKWHDDDGNLIRGKAVRP